MPNPVLTRQFGDASRGVSATADAAAQQTSPAVVVPDEDVMDIGSVLRATGLLFLLLAAGAVFGWANAEVISGIIAISFLALFGLLVVTMFKPRWVRVTGPIFAIAEGVLVGAISKIYSDFYDGIVLQAVLATMAVFVAMLILYAQRIIEVTERLRSTVILATAGIAIFYVISIVLSLFGVQIPYVWDGGPISILISALIVGVAAFNLLLDFDLIERGIREGAPGWMSWFAAFGLMVTVVWLYLELLRLIALTRD